MSTEASETKPGWTFLTNHAHVLLCLFDGSEKTMRDMAREVGITERAVQRIVADLRDAGYIELHRHGRRNGYTIHADKHLRHPIEAHRRIADLIQLIYNDARQEEQRRNR